MEKEVAQKQVKKGFLNGTGRRKNAVARVFLYQEKGDFFINDVNIDEYYTTEKDKIKWMRPFHLIGVSHPTSQFSGTIKVRGSGKSSQLGAIVHGISKALAAVNEEYSKLLHKQGLITRDPRMVERKKYFLRKARKAPQYSKR
ncbi:MAG TPA: 30S ribosomal protein S9 [Candidatus Saccharimonadales bacterium]|nr:30S ribosomal protein S9 [Candidatus Saccharimonadales bacterium]